MKNKQYKALCMWVHECLYTCVRVNNLDLMKANEGLYVSIIVLVIE